MVFLRFSCRGTAKNAIKNNRRDNTTGKKMFFSQLFWPRAFETDFLQNVFCGVVDLLLSLFEKRTKTPLQNLKKISPKNLPSCSLATSN
jgi:hypothetical protein